MVGQDESALHQFIFSKKQWKGPKGKEFLMPKSEGEIYMASGYTAREFAWPWAWITTYITHTQ
jgi:hypothetical protein